MKWLNHFLSSNHRLGFRIIKTGMAVTICVAISYILQLEYPFYAVIATVIAMGKSIDISFKAGKNRMIGTFIGAAIGIIFAMIDPGNIGLCGIGVIITLYCCHVLKLYSSATIACIVFSAIMLNLRGALPIVYGTNRILDTFIGIVVALLVNITVMPPNYVSDIKRAYAELSDRIKESIDFASTGEEIDIPAMEKLMNGLNANVTVYISEAKFLRNSDEEVSIISHKVAIYKQIVHELQCIQLLEERPIPPESDKRPVFEYHLDRVLALYETSEETA